MTMVEYVILQEIELWSRSGPPLLRKLCFERGRKRCFKGSYGLHVTENCPSLVCMGCAMTYVCCLRGARHLCDLHVEHGGIVTYNWMLSEDIAHAQLPKSVSQYQKMTNI